MIEVRGLTKHYGERVAVDDLTFTIKPGTVTGFLGPNGAGKSTTMRLILGLDRPTRGTATVNGKQYRDLSAPLHEVGALLEARAVHTGRSGYNHLLALAQTHGIPRTRVDEVIELVGLESVARKRVGDFSLGMGHRLGVAAALLGDPATVVLDEPANGLDPEGIRWIRNLLKGLAAEGRTVFLLIASDERDGADGRPPDRDRARTPDRRYRRRELCLPSLLRCAGARPLPAASRTGGSGQRERRAQRQARWRRAPGVRAARRTSGRSASWPLPSASFSMSSRRCRSPWRTPS